MAIDYHDGSRSLQDRFDTGRLADRIDERLVTDTIGESERAFIEAGDMFFWMRLEGTASVDLADPPADVRVRNSTGSRRRPTPHSAKPFG
jgi:hypothetical protein